jgi:putative FmdB family regulatory protein
VPIYEFRCGACGERFEALVEAGTGSVDCRACGAPAAERVLSAPAAPMHLVKSRGETRKQEHRNAGLRRAAKGRFRAARERRRGRPGPGSEG